MSTLSDIVQVTITSNSRGISRKSFGIPLVIAKHIHFAPRFKVYPMGTAPIDMVADGFNTNDPAYLAVVALARNTPKPERVIVGKLLTDFDHTFDITVKDIVALGNELYEFIILGPTGVATTISYLTIAADTETVIAAALDAQIDAIAGLSSAPAAGVISCSADTLSEMFRVNGLEETILDFEDTTVDSNLVAELSEITAQNGDWYGLILADPQSSARVQLLAGTVETQERIFGVTTHDTATGDPVSVTDVMFLLNAAQFFRTYSIYSGNQGAHAAATWMGGRFPIDPGASTWAFKPLPGVIVDSLESSFSDAIEAKKGNTYTTVSGAAITFEGTMSSGEFIDVIRGRDWLTVRLQERIFSLLINSPKVPFTNPGIDQVVSEVSAQMEEGISATYLSGDVPEGQDKAFIVTAPDVAAVPSADKIARLLPDVTFEATLAGAIHAVQVNGVIKI